MTRHDSVVKPLSRAERKAALLAELEQQRIDILVDSDTLLHASSRWNVIGKASNCRFTPLAALLRYALHVIQAVPWC